MNGGCRVVYIHSSSGQVMSEAEIIESGAVIGGRSISNIRYADDTALCGESSRNKQHCTQGKLCWEDKTTKIECPKKKRMVVGDEIANVSIGIGRETSSDAVII